MALGLLAVLLIVLQGSNAADIWSASSGVADSFAKNLRDLYCHKLFPVLMLTNLVLLAVTKDDKKLAILKRTLITLIVVFVVIEGYATIVQGTLTTIGQDVNANGNVSTDITW